MTNGSPSLSSQRPLIGSLAALLLLLSLPPPVQAQQPVVPQIRMPLRAVPVAAPTFQAPFQVGPRDRQVFRFTLDAPGTLRIRATWSDASRLALILNGPGQAGYYARQDGTSPLSIDFDVTEALLERGTQWQVSVVNFQASGAMGSGTLALSLPQPASSTPNPPAADAPLSRFLARTDTLRIPSRTTPSTMDLLRRPRMLTDGTLRFGLGNGLIAQLSPSDTLTIYDPTKPDSTQTTVLYSTHVQVDDPPIPPDALTTNADFSAWWMLMQAWMSGLNERMLLSIGEAFDENAMQTVEQLETENDRATSFDRADFRLRYLETSIPVLKEQIETLLRQLAADTPSEN